MNKTALFLASVGVVSLMAVSSANAGGSKMSFDDIRTSCLNPSKFHNQVPPTNIQISCKDMQVKWVADSEGTMNLANARQVTVSVASDKYNADAVSGAVNAQAQVQACPRFKEIAETVETVRAVTCNELVAFTGSAIEFCAGAVNALRAQNPSALTTVATGKVVDLCSNEKQQKPLE